jgi:hypothetical protein
MTPVEHRYRRQMRGWSLLLSAIVVLGLNADALAIFEQARTDPAFRGRMDTVGEPWRTVLARPAGSDVRRQESDPGPG